MKYSQQIGMALAVSIIAACWMPWVYIESKAIWVDGFHAPGTNFGRPGLFIAYTSGISFTLFFFNKIWAKRINVFITSVVFAWSIRNFLILSACFAGECPQKQVGLYLMIILSASMMMMSFLPKMKMVE